MQVYVPPPSHSNVHSAKLEADIPVYYSPYLGQNPKTYVTPLIVPKISDENTWSSPGYVRSGINKKTSEDVTELDDNNGEVLEATPYYKNQRDSFVYSKPISVGGSREKYVDVKVKSEQPNPSQQNTAQQNTAQQNTAQQNTAQQNTAQQNVANTPISQVYQGESQVVKRNINQDKINTSIKDVLGYPYETHEGVILPLTPNGAYTEAQLMKPPRNLYLQSLGPNEYSYSDVTYPINGNLGISYTPTLPPRVQDQVLSADTYPYNAQPLFHRIDPQLVRTNQPAGRAEELPTRSPWSANYSNYNTESGTVDYNNIYDGKFTGYGSPFRSYSDVNTGQVKYYYSDIDAYRQPNFIIRNKVDHVDFEDAMSRIIPEYPREVSLDDLKDQVEDQWDRDQISHREDLMESQMRKRNSEMYQLRMAPLMKQNYSNPIGGAKNG